MARDALDRRLLAASASLLALAALGGCTADARSDGLRTPTEPSGNLYYVHDFEGQWSDIQRAQTAAIKADEALYGCGSHFLDTAPSRIHGGHTADDTYHQLLTLESDLTHAIDTHENRYGTESAPEEERRVVMSETPLEIFRDLDILIPEAKRLAIACGTLTPETLAEPAGDTTWWDYSSGDGGYTPPPNYTPPH